MALNQPHQCPAKVTNHSNGPVDALMAQATNDPMPHMGDSVSRLDSMETSAWAGHRKHARSLTEMPETRTGDVTA